MADYENGRVKSLNREFKKLLDMQFEYTTDTERNKDVKHALNSDVWCLFLRLIAEDVFSDQTSRHIFSVLHKEIRRRQRLVR